MNQMIRSSNVTAEDLLGHLVAAHKARQARFAAAAATVVQVAPAEPKITPEKLAAKELSEQVAAEVKRRWEEVVETAAKQAAEAIDNALRTVPYPSIRLIIKVVAAAFDIYPTDIISHRRIAKVTIPRHIAIYLCRVTTPKSTPEIGKAIGGRDHSTILSSIHKVERLMEYDTEFRARVDGLRDAVLAERGRSGE
jgi:hypothetical protein